MGWDSPYESRIIIRRFTSYWFRYDLLSFQGETWSIVASVYLPYVWLTWNMRRKKIRHDKKRNPLLSFFCLFSWRIAFILMYTCRNKLPWSRIYESIQIISSYWSTYACASCNLWIYCYSNEKCKLVRN